MEGDAISDNVLALDGALRALGYETRIFAAHLLARPKSAEAEEAGRLESWLEEGDLILYQYSTGSALTEWFLRQRCRKAIVYQNITPPEYLEPYAPALADRVRRGREELAEVAAEVDFAFASSEYSAAELRALGCRTVTVLPVLLDYSRYEGEPDAALLEKCRDGKKNLLFVGRKAPNKCIQDVMLAADCYAAAYERPCRLILPGDESMSAYCAALRALEKELRAVELLWLGRISQASLLSCYRAADLFLCMSEHEGFCVPLVESMLFDVPVLAYAAAAVPETLGGSGVTFAEKDFARLAGVMDALLFDETLRRRVSAKQRARLGFFAPGRVREILRGSLQQLQ